jgi:hypothetical protein
MVREFIVCSCGDIEHQFNFCYEDDEDWDELYLQVHLNKLSFWKRLKYGIKYILGYQSKYGAFGEMYINQEDVDRMITTLQEYRNRTS